LIDIHSHILPGLDDGPATLDEAVAMVQLAADSGTTAIVATPHSNQLEYKTRLFGSRLTVRDCFYASSKTCSACGAKAQAMPLSCREWTCTRCEIMHDRDINAAVNLRLNPAGYAGIYACGEAGAVRPLAEAGTLPCAHVGAQER
jgi:hypothetical protein